MPFTAHMIAVVALLAAGLKCAVADEAVPFETLQVRALKGDFVRDGKLYLPAHAGAKVPVVLFLPGTDGVDQRFDFHRPGLLAAGIGVFEIDTKTGIFTGEKDRPENAFFEPIAFGALKALQAHPRIDPARIGAMGWSAGATVSVSVGYRSAVGKYLVSGEPPFAAHVGLYGGCTQQRVALTGAPILVLQGTVDTHVPVARCRTFAKNFSAGPVSYVEYPDVHHGFDKEGIDRDLNGRIMRWNPDAAVDARARVLAFFIKALKPESPG